MSEKTKYALVTGGSRGIGRAVCIQLAKDSDYKILINYNSNETAANETKVAVEAEGNKAELLKFDVANAESVSKSLDAWQESNPDAVIEVLVNNAGNAHGLSTIQDGSVDDWDAMLDINVKGLLYVTKAILPKMIENNTGFIVNIGSIAGKDVYRNGNVYCASKFAVNALNKSMRLDLNEYNIRVSGIHPGLVQTEFSDVRFKGDKEKAKTVYQGYKALQAEDIADIIHFVVTRPYHVNIEDLVVYPTAQASATMINKS